MNKTFIAITTLLILNAGALKAQTSLSFYNLGDATFQNASYNPAFVPHGKVFFGLPGLSGIHLHYNNRLSYSEVVSKLESGGSKVDLRKGLNNLGINNMLSIHSTISLLHFGIVANNGMSFSIFANERIEADLLYDNKVMNFIIRGNTTVIDQKIQVGKTRISATHFREYGIGVTYPSSDAGVVLGARVKYLQGFFNMSTPENQSAYLATNGETYVLTGDVSDFIVRSSGLNIAKGETGDIGSHLISNANRGFAVDLGFDWTVNKYNRISASLTDLGYIAWKEDIENRFVADTSFSYSGFDLENISNLESMVQDSLIDRFSIDKNQKAYNTLIGPKAYLSWTYKVNEYGGNMVSSLGMRYIQGKMKFLLGAGYQHKFGNFFVGSVNVTKLPQQFFNVGAALAVKGGPVQFYLAADQIYNFDVTKFQSFDFRVGINFIFGKRNGSDEQTRRGATTTISTEKVKKKGPGFNQSQSFMGRRVQVLRQEEIYNIIPKQGRRDPAEYMSEPPE
ncbi:MAG: hypothetical protein ACJA08_000557 [Cyclobacteriaceae bacterium]